MDIPDILTMLPLIVTILLTVFGAGGIVAVFLQMRYQKLQNLEEKIRLERQKVYLEILQPLFVLLKKPCTDEELFNVLNSVNYRKATYELSFIGSDEVIRAYGDLMQFFWNSETPNSPRMISSETNKKTLILMGNLLLAIRKDFGNNKTKLKNIDMLRHLIKDLYKFHESEVRENIESESSKQTNSGIPSVFVQSYKLLSNVTANDLTEKKNDIVREYSKEDQAVVTKINEMRDWMPPTMNFIAECAISEDFLKLGLNTVLLKTYIDKNIQEMKLLANSAETKKIDALKFVNYLENVKNGADFGTQAVDKHNSGQLTESVQLLTTAANHNIKAITNITQFQ